MRVNSIVAATATLICVAACSPPDQPTSTNENAVPPLSEPTLDGGAPVTIAPGGDTAYPVTPGGAGDGPPPVVTPGQSSGPATTP